MLKSIRNGALLAATLPRQYRAHRGIKLPVERLAERVAADEPVTFDRDIDHGRPGMFAELRSGRLMCTAVALPASVAGCLKAGNTTDPPAAFSASTNAWSDAASDGVEKSTSNTTSLTSALSSRRSSSAWRRRGQGQTPIFSIDGASIATTTMSPLA